MTIRAAVVPSTWLGTQADNIRDRDQKGRTQAGERHYKAKLTDAAIAEIRRRYAAGEASQQKLADAFGIGQQQISRIVRATNWTHLPQPQPGNQVAEAGEAA